MEKEDKFMAIVFCILAFIVCFGIGSCTYLKIQLAPIEDNNQCPKQPKTT